MAGFASSAATPTAQLVTLPASDVAALVLSVMSTESASAIGVLLAHVTTAPAAVHVQLGPVPLVKVSPAGSVSTTLSGPTVGTLPRLATRRIQLLSMPLVNCAEPAVFFTSRSTVPRTTLPLVARLSVVSASVGTLARARLVTAGKAALVTSVVTVIGVAAPTASAAVAVHVTTWPAAAQLKPAPPADWKVSPIGSESTTVKPAGAGRLPTLDTVTV